MLKVCSQIAIIFKKWGCYGPGKYIQVTKFKMFDGLLDVAYEGEKGFTGGID